ncbi:MAG TPA: tetratricopeptide repeat protein [Terriglobales bacterium]|nr:tetratricopeptide repeat protein [Terriglobales bacterium]
MKYSIVCASLLLLCGSMFAQRGGKNPNRNIPIAPPGPGMAPNNTGNVFLSGTVAMDDGTKLTEPAAIQSVCRGQKHTETYTDSHGNFSFEIGRSVNANSAGLSDADTSWANSGPNRARSLQDCELQASLAGFTSDSVTLATKVSMGESANVGRIVLHRIAKVEGLTISATTAAAPGPARKAYEKGCKHEAKNEWDQAEESLKKAVEVYPRYAIAWFELGRVQQHQNDAEAARHSFQQSIGADPGYANPYRNLAQLAAIAKQWTEVVELTTKLLALNAVNFPDAWFLNSVAHYEQQHLEDAEKSARQGLRIDADHHIPKLEFLLGVVLADRHNYDEAVVHLRRYLQLIPAGNEADTIRKQLSQFEQLATPQPSTAANQK